MTPRSRTRMGDDAAGGMGMAPVADRSSPGARMLAAMGGSGGKGKGKARDYGDRYVRRLLRLMDCNAHIAGL